MKYLLAVCLFGLSTLFLSCGKDKNDVTQPVNENEEELITSVLVKVNDGSTIKISQWQDLDGEGGNNPTVQPILLSASKTYSVEVQFLDESNPNDIDDITLEIEDEGHEHLICFTPSDTALTVTYKDQDKNGFPIGIQTNWSATKSFTGNLKLVLKHQPDIKTTVDCDAGETDIDVTFPIVVVN